MLRGAAIELDNRYAARRAKSARRHQQIDGLIEVPGAVVRARVAGRGPRAIVIAPDPPNVIEHYDHAMPELLARARVVILEPPGFGFSYAAPSYRFTADDWGDVLCAVLDTLEVRGAIGVFSCLGAFGALVAARKRPDLFERLILSQIASHAVMCDWIHRHSIHGLATTPFVGQVISGLGRKVVTRGWYDLAAPHGHDWTGLHATAAGAQRRGGNFCLASAYQAILADDASYAGAGHDTTLLWGDGDPTHQCTDPETFRAHLPGARIIRCSDCGHFPHLERLDVFLGCIDE